MISLLMVDDEPYVLEGYRSSLDFSALGITEVLSATSVEQAKEMLAQRSVDILLADIEVGNESGLDLAQWLQDRGESPILLFCTSYADFDYAQRAVKLHSFDYFLKPISYSELAERLAAAIRSLQRHPPEGDTGFSFERHRQFWSKVILSKQPLEQAIQKVQKGTALYAPGAIFFFALFYVYDDTPSLCAQSAYAFRDQIEHFFLERNLRPEAFLPLGDAEWLMIFQEKDEAFFASWKETFLLFRDFWLGRMDGDMIGYYWQGASIGEARRIKNLLTQVMIDDVIRTGALISAKDYVFRGCLYQPEEIREWPLQTAQDLKPFLERLDAYLQKKSAVINAKFLNALAIDLQQKLYAFFSRMQISAHQLFQTEEYEALRSASLLSVNKFQHYVHYTFHIAEEYLFLLERSASLSGYLKSYIEDHLQEDLNRNTLAAQVFLNPDYLSRIFKRQNGLSLTAYVQARRLEKAKEMLAKTEISIGEIAQQVGIHDYSYFSYVFRKNTGISPNEYRKQNFFPMKPDEKI